MALVTQDVPNLSNGVSQQPAIQRLTSQGQRQENCISSVVDGMRRRPPTRHIAKVSAGQFSSAFFHVVDRDEATQYAAVITNGNLQVFDMITGAERVVWFPNGKAYLTNTDPKLSFRAVTAADYTFVVNRGVLTGMTGDKSPVPPPTALVSFLAANYRETFALTVAGVTFTLQLPAATANEATREALNTSLVASGMYQLLVNGIFEGGAGGTSGSSTGGSLTALGYTVGIAGSCLTITKNDGADFTIQASDGAGGTHMRAFKGSTQKFTDLPKVGVDGFQIKIVGDPGDEGTNYWVKYQVATSPPVITTPPTGGNTGVPPPSYGGGYKHDNHTHIP